MLSCMKAPLKSEFPTCSAPGSGHESSACMGSGPAPRTSNMKLKSGQASVALLSGSMAREFTDRMNSAIMGDSPFMVYCSEGAGDVSTEATAQALHEMQGCWALTR